MPPKSPFRWGFIPLACLACLAIPVRADEDEALKPAEVILEEDLIVGDGLPPEIFDTWVLGAQPGGQPAEKRVRDQLLNRADEEIDRIDGWCKLTEAQSKKLELAARGDIAQLFDRIAAARARFMQNRQRAVNQRALVDELRELQTAVRSLEFSSSPLFRKTLKGLLSPEQRGKFDVATRRIRLAKCRQAISQAVVQMQHVGPLTPDQRTRIADLIEREIPLGQLRGPSASQVVLYHLSKLSEEKLKTVLDQQQANAWTQRLRAYQQMGPRLERMGLLTDVEDDVKPEEKDLKVRVFAE